jgi:hypothetical protein
MKLNSIYRKCKQTPWQEMNDEVLVMTPNEKTVHELNSVAGFIFKQVDGNTNVQSLLEKLLNEYDVTEETANKDLDTLLSSLTLKGLIEVTEAH